MNFPTIPDNFYKILILFCLGILFFCYYENEKKDLEIDKFIIESDIKLNNFQDQTMILNNELLFYLDDLYYLEDKFKIKKSFILNSVYDIKIDPTIFKDSLGSAQIDSIKSIIRKYEYNALKLEVLNKKIANHKVLLNNVQTKLDDSNSLITLASLSFLIIVLSLLKLYNEYLQELDYKKNDYLSKPKFRDCCQSCAKKFSSMVEKGINMDNSISNAYCNTCFNDGKFTDIYNSEDDVKKEIKNNKSLTILSRYNALSKISHLERWNKNPY